MYLSIGVPSFYLLYTYFNVYLNLENPLLNEVNRLYNYLHLTLPSEVYIQSIITLHQQNVQAEYCFAGEQHDFWEIQCVTKGKARCINGDETLILSENDIIIHAPNQFHAIETCDEEYFNLFVMSFDAIGNSMDYFRNRVVHLNEQQSNSLDSLITLSQTIFTFHHACQYTYERDLGVTPDLTELQIFKNQLELFLLQLLPSFDKETKQEYDGASAPYISGKAILSKAIEILNNYKYSNISISTLCAELNVSSGYLSSLFKKHTGKTVIEYYNSIKINEAIRLLTSKNTNITEIAEMLGFSSIHYFSRLFKLYVGISPLNYIKMNSSKSN